MSDRDKYKGEEELQVLLLDVSEDPTSRASILHKKRVLSVIGKVDADGRCEIEPHEVGILH